MDEIIDQAIQIEISGEEIYKKLESIAPSDNLKLLFKTLSSQEREHKEFFLKMKETFSSLAQEKKIERILPLDIFKDKIFNRIDVLKKLMGPKSIYELLDACVENELEVIKYYTHLQNFLSTKDQSYMTSVINEEKNHVKYLLNERNKYKTVL